jgi:hypothetical protein
MQEIHERCAGLDVHKDLIVASARWKVGASVRHAVAEFVDDHQKARNLRPATPVGCHGG